MKPDEFARTVLSYETEIAAYARRLVATDWDADDLVQATFERAFRARTELRDLTRARAWLFQIARNLHRDRMRADRARPEVRLVRPAEDAVVPWPEVRAETVERAAAEQLEAALSVLPELQRQAVLLCDLWGFSYEEIAAIEAVPVGTVRSRIARARAELCAWLRRTQAREAKGGGR